MVDGRYEVLSRIARGGMATVYLATDRRLDREVALKVMHPHLAEGGAGSEFVARFRREARAAARLTHPGLVGVFDQGVDGDTSYLTMEYVEGTNLRRHLGEQGSLPVREALATTESVLDALAAAHRAGLVHRDVKPENVLLATDGRVKVADFGLARAVTEVTATATGTVLGTVAYLAPELVAHGASDPRTDVYAVGILLYEMLTGSQPFTGATPIQVAYQHVNSDIPSPSDAVRWLPVEIDELVEALAARDPAERPVHAGAALALVRQTRAALDEATLDRRADVQPSLTLPPATDGVPGEAPAGVDGADGTDAGDSAAPGQDAPAEDERATSAVASATSMTATDHDATTVLDVPGRSPAPEDDDEGPGRTVALQIGTGLHDDDTATSGDERSEPAALRTWRTRVRALLIAIAVVAVGGILAVWYAAWGPGAYATVPAGLVGASLAEAQEALTAQRLAHTSEEVFHPTAPAGDVVAVDPGEGDRILKDGTVEIAVSKGPDLRVVPEGLVGTPTDAAVAALTEAGFEVPEPTPQYSDTVAEGDVVALSVEDGASLPVGTEVVVTTSRGPEPVVVKSVIGAEREQATAVLEADGLVVEIVEEYTEDYETYPAGVVMAQTPEPEADAFRTDTVTLTVSLGAPLVEVPNVLRQGVEAATNTLEAAGFVVETQRADAYFGLGFVVGQSVNGGAQAPKGSAITLTIT
nr:Stk1 family PASTA domain-containing Ser/Thr kinase [Cellulomonas sp. APG4]